MYNSISGTFITSHIKLLQYVGWKLIREKFAELKEKNHGRGPSRGIPGEAHSRAVGRAVSVTIFPSVAIS